MTARIRELWQSLDRSIYVGDRGSNNLKGMMLCGIVIAFIGLSTTGLNIRTHRGYATYATAAITLTGIAMAYLAGVKQNRKATGVLAGIMCIALFTSFAVYGINDGFAICWIVLVPLAYSYFVKVKWGLILGSYYQLLLIALFYTPARAAMKQYYTDTFMDRFPILFFCDLMLSAVAMVQYHIMTLRQIDNENDLKREVEEQTRIIREDADKLEKLSVQVVESLAVAIDAKDEYTNGHSSRVAEYSVLIAERAGMGEDELEELRMEALLHDIGKIGIPDEILNKPGRLDDDEYSTIKQHTVIGSEILRHIQTLPGAATVARSHHERYDGKGYPDGLKRDEIPLHARIVAVADAYDAMHSDRVYRRGLPDEVIFSELERGRGTQFDPLYVDELLKVLGRSAFKSMDNDAVSKFDAHPELIYDTAISSAAEQP